MVTTLMTPTVDLTGPANAAVVRGSSVNGAPTRTGTSVQAAAYHAGSWAPTFDGTTVYRVEGPAMGIRRDDAPFGNVRTDLSTNPSHVRVLAREIPV